MSNYETYAKPCGHVHSCVHDFEDDVETSLPGDLQAIVDAAPKKCDDCWEKTPDVAARECGLNLCDECAPMYA